MKECFGRLHDSISIQTGEGTTSRETLPFLFVPGTVLIWQDGDVERTGTLVSWPEKTEWIYDFQLWNWSFDGHFCKHYFQKYVNFKSSFSTEHGESPSIPITDLPCYPIRFAKAEVQDQRRKAGHSYWRCRRRKFVTYNGWDFRRDDWNVRASGQLRNTFWHVSRLIAGT